MQPDAVCARRRLRGAIILIIFAIGIPACSDKATRHRVLQFFFDGVPEPGAVTQIGYAPNTRSGQRPFSAPPERTLPDVVAYSHTPYSTGDCGGCHDPNSGGLTRTAKEGLCRSCHPDVPGGARYVHGPVAVDACLFCHHPHGSMHPGILNAAATTLCLRCHDRADLTEGSHHENLDTVTCTQCHDAHAGNDRFFLK